jgi:CopA family copper-resistance protein
MIIRRDPLLTGLALTRRRFIQGVAAAGALSVLPWRLHAALAASASAPVLSGTDFQLEIGAVPLTINGRQTMATGINGQVPAPILRWRQGQTVTLAVTNRLSEPSSIHWHGVRTPARMDGVPGFSFGGIAPGETFVYRFPVRQSGTYWYHSHTMFQEQTGLYGAIVIEPKAGYTQAFDRDYIVLLSDWSFEQPETIVSNLKFQSSYYNFGQRTLGTFIHDAESKGLSETIADRLDWGKMRMSPTDILDVSGATYTYLVNGQPPGANWTALFGPGERVRLRFINGSSMSIFDVRIDGLPMTVVQADGNDIEPVIADEFRISVAETYDVIVRPEADRAYTIFAQAEDRSGYARGTLAPRAGMAGAIPPLDARPMRTMADMGMAGMEHGEMPGMQLSPEGKRLEGTVAVDNVAMMPAARFDSAGEGFPAGRRVLRYADLRATRPGADPRPPARDITFHLTGNMERFIWASMARNFPKLSRSCSSAANGCASC